MNMSTIIYLDASFITDAYEIFTGSPVPIRIVKSENLSGGFSAGIFSAGAAAQETKEFPITARAMYEEMRSDMEEFPSIELANTEAKDLPDYFWTSGIFAIGATEVTRSQEVIHRDAYFRLYDRREEKKGVYMLTSDTYFTTGYDQVLRHVYGATQGFDITVKALVKLLALQESNFWPLCTPLVMVRTGNE